VTAPARAAFLSGFRKQAAEIAAARGETLTPEEIDRRAEHLKKAHFQRMAFEREKARRKRAAADG
jgi:hypothetical protein